MPDPETIRDLGDDRFAFTGEAHLTRGDGGGVSTPIHRVATVRDGCVVLIEGRLGAGGGA